MRGPTQAHDIAVSRRLPGVVRTACETTVLLLTLFLRFFFKDQQGANPTIALDSTVTGYALQAHVGADPNGSG